MEDPSKFFNDFVGVAVSVPCKTWDPEYAARCFGPDYETKSVDGVVCKVKMSRHGKVPRFDINFAEKPGEKVYVNFDLDYILRYSDEVPLKYHNLKAEYIVKLAVEANKAEINTCLNNSTTTENEDAVAGEVAEYPAEEVQQSSSKGKGKRKASTPLSADKQVNRVDDHLELSVSDIDSDSEPDIDQVDEEDLLYYSEDVPLEEEDSTFSADKWGFMDMPTHPTRDFSGHAGPKHTLPTSATPFQFFSLFIPCYFWAKWAFYTNVKAAMGQESTEKKCRNWKATCEAELKAWVASVICWSMFKTISFANFYKYAGDPNRVISWFPSLTRWEQIKRFFKVSDPLTDSGTQRGQNVAY